MPVTIVYQHEEQELVVQALTTFRANTGIVGRIVPDTPHRLNTPDAIIEFERGGHSIRFNVEVKSVDRIHALISAKEQLRRHHGNGLLIAPYISPQMAAHCRETLKLQYLDGAGNAYIDVDEMVVFIGGQKPQERSSAAGAKGAGTSTGIRIILALFQRPSLINATYREIAKEAGVALGAVGRVLQELEDRGYLLVDRSKGTRRLVERRQLIDEWSANYVTNLRPKLHPMRFSAEQVTWWKAANLPAGAQWGGEVGAEKTFGHLRAQHATIYVSPETRHDLMKFLLSVFRLRRDLHGNTEVVNAFWDTQQTKLSPPLVIYADLLNSLDPRNVEVAKVIGDSFAATQ